MSKVLKCYKKNRNSENRKMTPIFQCYEFRTNTMYSTQTLEEYSSAKELTRLLKEANPKKVNLEESEERIIMGTWHEEDSDDDDDDSSSEGDDSNDILGELNGSDSPSPASNKDAK